MSTISCTAPGEPLNSWIFPSAPTGTITVAAMVCPAWKFRFDVPGRRAPDRPHRDVPAGLRIDDGHRRHRPGHPAARRGDLHRDGPQRRHRAGDLQTQPGIGDPRGHRPDRAGGRRCPGQGEAVDIDDQLHRAGRAVEQLDNAVVRSPGRSPWPRRSARPGSSGSTSPVGCCRPGHTVMYPAACGSTTVTGTSWPPIAPSPRAVAVKPATLAFARSFGMVCAAVSPECGFPTATSQFQPAQPGVADDVGEAGPEHQRGDDRGERQHGAQHRGPDRHRGAVARPGSNARRKPATAGRGEPAAGHPAARREPRPRLGRRGSACLQATRWAVRAARAVSRSVSRAAPPSRTGASNESPGEIARRARPIGVNTDRA